ncbi:hypothetical protein [Enemella sp. A6]|uniref:hypothetical protein n=1 Tax=Enemella sp. A6 TaxID=3440152 RepID=UPI003EC02521
MATAAEIRKRVRDAEKRRVQARAEAAIQVADAAARLTAAEEALVAAMDDLEQAVSAAVSDQGYGVEELAQVTDVDLRRLRWPRSVQILRDTLKGTGRKTDRDDENQGEPDSEEVARHAPAEPHH